MQVSTLQQSRGAAQAVFARPSAGRAWGPAPFVPAQLAQRQRKPQLKQRAEPEAAPEPAASSARAPAAAAAAGGQDEEEETVFYEGSGSDAELALSILLGFTLICLPLTLASIGRRLWIKYRFTNKRLIITTNSPVLQREVQVEYRKIKEIRSAPRGGGLWGDVVIFLKDGSRVPLAGLERHREIVDHIEGFITD